MWEGWQFQSPCRWDGQGVAKSIMGEILYIEETFQSYVGRRGNISAMNISETAAAQLARCLRTCFLDYGIAPYVGRGK